MKFFYADALDLVDPRYDFERDASPPDRIAQQDDLYAHELMAPEKPYDGLLVSKYIVEGHGGQGRYSQAQRQRFIRQGAQRFLRYPADGRFDPEDYPIIADCGAFNYRSEPRPPFSVDEVLEFYDLGNFTHGVSVDHMIGAYNKQYDNEMLPTMGVPEEYRYRYELTLELADEFLCKQKRGNYRFRPIGVAQGFSPRSYCEAVRALMKMGYQHIALGGLVPLKTPELLEVVTAVGEETGGHIPLHLFGVTRLKNFKAYSRAGVVSFDSTSPLRQAFKDARDNYYAQDRHYTAIRIPQGDAYPKLLKSIRAGQIDHDESMKAEQRCLDLMRAFAGQQVGIAEVLGALQYYESLYGGKSEWDAIQRTLEDRPWELCSCPVCRDIGIDVIIFRGANRNRRRGFHNLWFTRELLLRHRNGHSE